MYRHESVSKVKEEDHKVLQYSVDSADCKTSLAEPGLFFNLFDAEIPKVLWHPTGDMDCDLDKWVSSWNCSARTSCQLFVLSAAAFVLCSTAQLFGCQSFVLRVNVERKKPFS